MLLATFFFRLAVCPYVIVSVFADNSSPGDQVTATVAPAAEIPAVSSVNLPAAPAVVAMPPPGTPALPGEQAFALNPELLKLRDPFRSPDLDTAGPQKSELEQYSVDSFKLVGVLTGLDHLRALVQAPDGKTFFIAEKTKIGLRGGVVRKILPEKVQVRERNINVVGQVENIDSELVLNSVGPSSLMSRITLAEPETDSSHPLDNLTGNLGSLLAPRIDSEAEQGKSK